MRTASPTRTKRRWVVAALAVVGVGTAAAQFGPMVFAVSNEAPSRTGHNASPTQSPRPIAADFSSISSGGGPPPDVLGALAVPAGSISVGHDAYDKASGTFDRALDYRNILSREAIISFYKSLLPGRKWSVSGVFPVPHGTGQEILARHTGSDGYYWEVGISSPAPPSASVHATFQVRLQIVEDQQ